MAPFSKRKERRDTRLNDLTTAIDSTNVAKDGSGIPPAQTAFGSTSALLGMIRVRTPTFCRNGLPTSDYVGLDG